MLADHYSITQLVVEPGSAVYDLISGLPKETVIRVDGKVVARDAAAINPAMITGEIEVRIADAEVLGNRTHCAFTVFHELRVPRRYAASPTASSICANRRCTPTSFCGRRSSRRSGAEWSTSGSSNTRPRP